MALDHGTLNIPLSKRGNIDAQIDAYKAGIAIAAAADRKTRSAKTAEDRKLAKALLGSVSSERIAELATRSNCTSTALRAALKSDAHWQPELVITVLSPKPAA